MKKLKYFNILKKKISSKSLNVGIVGLGYVGLPLALAFAKQNVKIIGLDNDLKKIKTLKRGKSYIKTISNKEIKLNSKLTIFSNKNNIIKKCDVVIFCLPTPLTKNFEPDLSYVENTFNEVSKYFKKNTLICLESTTYPGTTEDIFANNLKKKFIIGENIFLGYSPEREDPGNKKFSIDKITKVVAGYSKNCLNLMDTLYSIITKTYKVSNLKTAETTKLFENIFRSVNIGLVNEMKIICDKMKLDVHEIIDAAKTKPFGYMEFRPGPGLGGHCIPIDPFLLTWKAKEYGVNTRFIELSGQINSEMPNYVCNKIVNHFAKTTINRKPKILIIGLSYKKNTDDIREAPSLKIIEILNKINFEIVYYDDYFPKFPKSRNCNFTKKKYDIYKNKMKDIDLAVLVTDHDNFDYNYIYKNAKHIVDTRGKFKKSKKVTFA